MPVSIWQHSAMSVARAPTRRLRPSFEERERVALRLRSACAEERLSVDTLSQRLEIAYSARSQAELDWLVADLPEPSGLTRVMVAVVNEKPSPPAGSGWPLASSTDWPDGSVSPGRTMVW